MPFTKAQYDVLDLTLLFASLFGILGSAFVACTTAFAESTNAPITKAIFWLAIGDLALAMAYLADGLSDPRDVVPGLSDSSARRRMEPACNS